MAANLVRRYAADEAHHLLNLSFAQFQADQAVVRMETRLARRESALAEVRAEATCERGDIDSYRALVVAAERATGNERTDGPGSDRHQARAQIELAMSRLRPGDVIQQPGRNADAHYAVLTVARRKGGAVRLRVLTKRGRVVSLAGNDFDGSTGGRGQGDPPGAVSPPTTGASNRSWPGSSVISPPRPQARAAVGRTARRGSTGQERSRS